MSTETNAAPSGWTLGIPALSALGLGIALYLTKLHLDLLYGGGGSSLCDVSSAVNCSAVNASKYSEVGGVPQALLAIPTYVVTFALGLAARSDRRALALAGFIATLTVLYSAWLAYVSSALVGAWCLFCIALYAVNVGMAVCAFKASGGGLVADMMKLPTAAMGLLALTGVGTALAGGGAWVVYEGERAKMTAEAAAAAVAKVPPRPAATPTPAGATGSDGTQTKNVRLPDKRYEFKLPKDVASRGPKDAKVTIVEFSDFQCPFCMRLAEGLRQLGDEYPNDVRLVYVQFPLNKDCNKGNLLKTLHPDACGASAASVCAGAQGKFWEMHDKLFANQADLRRKTYLAFASDLGLDVDRYGQCLDDPATMAKISAETEVSLPAQVSGTPTFFINGREMAGAQAIEVLRAVVDAELRGESGALNLDVQVGTESTGPVAGAEQVSVSTLGAPFQIDAFEASLDGAKAVSTPQVEPARSVSWFEARDACKAAGKRLCTEQEWLAACTGAAPRDQDGDGIWSNDDIQGRRYGYADVRKAGVCSDSRDPDAPGTILTGNHPQCGTPDGIYDLIGNVKEWVGLSPSSAALKGGSYSSGDSARCGYYRDDIAAETKDAATGFRCCEGPADIPETRPGRDVGEKLGSFTLPLQAGGTFDSKSLKGHPAIVNFWASWCGPCKKELPILQTLYAKYKDQGLMIVAVSVDSDAKALSTFLTSSPLPFIIAHDPQRALMDTFTNRGVPTSIWVKKDGTIRLRTTGIPPGQDKRLEALVTELMGG